MQRGIINLTMAEIELLKGFTANHELLKDTDILCKLLEWEPTPDTTKPAYDLELSLEDADTIIDTLHTILVDNQIEQASVQTLVEKFQTFYSEKLISDNSTAT